MGDWERLTSLGLRIKTWLATGIRRGLEGARIISPTQFSAVVLPDHPDLETLPAGLLYVVGGKAYQKWAFLVCPCGCGERIMLSLAKNRRPRWQVELDWLQRPTVKPSVWQTDGCYSHFWIKKGIIHWTSDTGSPHYSRLGNEG